MGLKLNTTSVPTSSVMLGGKKVRFPPGPTSIVVWRRPPIGLVPGTVLVEAIFAAFANASKVLPVAGLKGEVSRKIILEGCCENH